MRFTGTALKPYKLESTFKKITIGGKKMEKCPKCGKDLVQIRPLYKYYECKHCETFWEIRESSREAVDRFLERLNHKSGK